MKPYPSSWSRELRTSLTESDARAARLVADLERHTVKREALSWLGNPIAVGVIDIPIWQPQSFTQEQKTEMTTAEKISFLKNLAPPHTQVVNAQSATKSSTFDPRAMWRNRSINVIFPAAPRDDFSDDRSNSPRDDFDEPNEHSNLGMAHDLIGCELSGESGPGCGHNNCDHVQAAISCLQNYSREQAMRDRNRDMAEKSTMVRFA